jgi:hypothetical protein
MILLNMSIHFPGVYQIGEGIGALLAFHGTSGGMVMP